MPPKGKGRKSNIEAYRDAMAIVKLVDHDCMEVADAAKALGLTPSTAYRLLSRARGMLLTPQIEADKKTAVTAVNRWYEVDPNLTTEGLVDTPSPTLMTAATAVNNAFTYRDDGPPFDKGIDSIPVVASSADAKKDRPEGSVNLPPATAMELHDAGHREGSPDPQADLATATAMEPAPVAMKVPEVLEPPPVVEREFITLPDGTKRRIRPQEPTENIYEWSHLMDYSSFRTKTPWRQAQLIAQWKENEALGGKHVNLRGGIKNRTCFRGCPSYQCTCEDNL